MFEIDAELLFEEVAEFLEEQAPPPPVFVRPSVAVPVPPPLGWVGYDG
ncbi:hypothetical protein ACFQ2B_27790 [Streptomyces stramineus]